MQSAKIFPSYNVKTKAYYKNNTPVIAEIIRDEKGGVAAVREFINVTGENGQKIKGYLTLDKNGREISFYTYKFNKDGEIIDTVLTRVRKDGSTVTIRKKTPFYDNLGVKKIYESSTVLKDANEKVIAEKSRTTVRVFDSVESQIFKFKNKCGRLFFNKTKKCTVLCEYDSFNILKGRIDLLGKKLVNSKLSAEKTVSSIAKHLLKSCKK